MAERRESEERSSDEERHRCGRHRGDHAGRGARTCAGCTANSPINEFSITPSSTQAEDIRTSRR